MWIKICGIRDVAQAQAVARLGPDAIGLNFFARSPRCVSVETAAEISLALPKQIMPVGVFVNHAFDEVREIARRCRLGAIQLHGDEPPEALAELREWPVIRAFRVGDDGLAPLADYLDKCQKLSAMPWACLVEARVEGAYGGTGKLAPWELVARDYLVAAWPRLILAGGLTPANVAAGISAVRPWGVDVAGGVESALACKDPELVRQFIARARSAAAG
jgi:phosphoribosylanthranilate isomerase